METVDLTKKSFVVATHIFTTGPAQDLKEYLIKKSSDRLLFIGHPLFIDSRLKDSGYEYFEKGKLLKSFYPPLKKKNIGLYEYFIDSVKTIWWVVKSGKKWDVFIGSANANAFSGIVLKWLGYVEYAVYYVIDYNPYRFKNKFMNRVYHFVDHFCVKYADVTWNLSPRMIEGRKKYFNIPTGKQTVLPIGVWSDRIQTKSEDAISLHSLVFMGHIIKKQGIQHVVRAIPDIIKEVPDFKFTIVGDGDYLEEVCKLMKSLDVERYVDVKGFIEDDAELESILTNSAAAVALYDKYDEDGKYTFTYYADPGKIKLYLACGTYVFTTDVSYNIQNLRIKNLCYVVNNFTEDLLNTFKDPNWKSNLNKFKSEAKMYSSQNDWNYLFNKAFADLLKDEN